ncbi:WD repeat-containing protein 87 [Chytriomyces hyalinus]|nr:WD repeat-containing protein 87 [Chytriomyces hyalinus]
MSAVKLRQPVRPSSAKPASNEHDDKLRIKYLTDETIRSTHNGKPEQDLNPMLAHSNEESTEAKKRRMERRFISGKKQLANDYRKRNYAAKEAGVVDSPIQPWQFVRGLFVKKVLQISDSANSEARRPTSGDSTASRDSDEVTAEQNMDALGAPILPFGFQLERTIHSHQNNNTPIKSVMYIPPSAAQAIHCLRACDAKNASSRGTVPDETQHDPSQDDSNHAGNNNSAGREVLLALDANSASLWRGSDVALKVDVSNKMSSLKKSQPLATSVNGVVSGVGSGAVGMDRILIVEKYRVYITFSNQLQLKILDMHFNELAKVSCPAPILSMAFVESKSLLLTGETGSVRFWEIKRSTNHHVVAYQIIERKSISEPFFDFDQWIVFIMWERILDRVIAVCDATVFFFDTNNGTLLDAMKDAHKLSITCCVFYEPLEYLVTAAKDGTIKVWNSQNCILNEFDHHVAAVTSVKLLERHASSSKRPPIILSSSLDGTVRMWNIDLGTCLYRLDTLTPILGLSFIQKETILLHGSNIIQTWSMNQIVHKFKFSNSRPLLVRRYSRPQYRSARLLAAFSDGSLKLLSPATGELLIIGFPIYKDSITLDFEYDTVAEKVYARNSNGDVVVYSAKLNPMKVLDVWEPVLHDSQINCMCGIHFIVDEYPEYLNEDSNERRSEFLKGGCSFFLVAGAADGQLVNLVTTAKKKIKQEAIIQAHSGQITALKFDHLNLLLISGGTDDVIKVWKVSPSLNYNVHNSKETLSSISLECVAVVTIAHLNDFGVEKPALDETMSINPFNQTVSVPWNGRLRVISYAQDGKLFPRPSTVKKPAKLTAVTCSMQYGIWASSDSDGSIKIWDSSGSLLREIQMLGQISCVLFSNIRGDLLFGLQDQIAVLCVQDYFTVPLMKKAIELSTRSDFKDEDPRASEVATRQMLKDDLDCDSVHDANGYQDDFIERAPIFDSNADFWDIFYEDQKEIYGNVRWHIPKGLQITKLDDRMEFQIETWKREIDDQETAKRRNRRLFLEMESVAHNTAELFEEKYVASKNNAAHMKGAYVKGQEISQEEPELVEDGDFIFLRRVDSEQSLLPVGVLGLDTPRRRKLDAKRLNHASNWKAVQDTFIIGNKLGPLIQAAVAQNRAQLAMIEKQILSNPNRKRIANKPKQDRDRVRNQLIKSGVALPNSVVAMRNRRPSQTQLVEPSVHANTKNGLDPKNPVMLRKASARPEWWYQDDDTDDMAADTMSKNVKYAEVKKPDIKVGKSSQPPAVEISELLEEEDGTNHEEITPVIVENKTEAETQAQLSPSHKGRPKKPQLAPPQPDQPLTRPQSFIDVMKMALARSRDLQETPKKQPKPPKSAKPKKSHQRPKSKLVDVVPEVKITFQDPVPAPEPARPKPIVTVVPPPPVVHVKIAPSPQPPSTIYVPETKFDSTVSSDVSDDGQMIVEDMNRVSDMEAAAYAWNLLRMRQGIGIPTSLKKVVDQFWFKELEGEPFDLEHVIKALILLLQTGNWSECCEASKALLYIYMTFKKDIPDPFHIFVVPHLEVLDSSEFWQTRAQICSNLAAFRVRHRSVYHSLIIRLNDSNVIVRATAKKSLMYLDIDTRSKLLAVMKTLGFFACEYQKPKLNRLEILEKKLKKKDIAVAAEVDECVTAWRSALSEIRIPEINQRSNARHTRRPSYFEHLAGPFFIPDGPDKPNWGGMYRPPSSLASEYRRLQIPQDTTQWNTPSFDYDLKSWTDYEAGSETKEKSNRENRLNALVEGKPTAKVRLENSRPRTAQMKAVLSQLRPLSAGIRADVAPEFRKTNKRPKSAFVVESLREIAPALSRKRPETASPYTAVVDVRPYNVCESFENRKPKKLVHLKVESRRAWH